MRLRRFRPTECWMTSSRTPSTKSSEQAIANDVICSLGSAEPRSSAMQANESEEMKAACHCGTVRFRVKLTDGFNTARRCTCSYCRMRGAVAVSADVGGITFDAGEEALT